MDEGAAAIALPDATNTGLNVELGGSLPALTNDDAASLSTAAATYHARRFTRTVTVSAPGISFTGCQFDAGVMVGAGADKCLMKNCKFVGGTYGVRCWDGAAGVVIENCEFDGSSAPGAIASKGIAGFNFTARRCNVHHTGSDGIFVVGGNTVIEYNYIHHVSYGGWNGGAPKWDHADGIQLINGGDKHTWRYNHIRLPLTEYNQSPWGGLNACLTMQDTDLTDFVIEGNWLYGGGYTIRLEPNGKTMTGGKLVDNHIGPKPKHKDVLFGPLNNAGARISARGNRYDYPGDRTGDGSVAFQTPGRQPQPRN